MHQAEELREGDLCFILSYSKIVPSDILSRHKNNLVIHASDLPEGRGWSPATWMILEGKKTIPVSLLEAVHEVDAGPIYNQAKVELDEEDLIDDWRQKLAVQVKTDRRFCCNYPSSLDSKRNQKGNQVFTANDSQKIARLMSIYHSRISSTYYGLLIMINTPRSLGLPMQTLLSALITPRSAKKN